MRNFPCCLASILGPLHVLWESFFWLLSHVIYWVNSQKKPVKGHVEDLNPCIYHPVIMRPLMVRFSKCSHLYISLVNTTYDVYTIGFWGQVIWQKFLPRFDASFDIKMMVKIYATSELPANWPGLTSLYGWIGWLAGLVNWYLWRGSLDLKTISMAYIFIIISETYSGLVTLLIY